MKKFPAKVGPGNDFLIYPNPGMKHLGGGVDIFTVCHLMKIDASWLNHSTYLATNSSLPLQSLRTDKILILTIKSIFTAIAHLK